MATCDPSADNPTFQVKGEIRTLVFVRNFTTAVQRCMCCVSRGETPATGYAGSFFFCLARFVCRFVAFACTQISDSNPTACAIVFAKHYRCICVCVLCVHACAAGTGRDDQVCVCSPTKSTATTNTATTTTNATTSLSAIIRMS